MNNTELALAEAIEIDPPQPQLSANQPIDPPRKPYLCRHIFVDGRQCGSRALRGENFCYYHHTYRTPVLVNQRRRQPASGFDLTSLDGLDNPASIQLLLCQVLGRIANNSIDPKRAWLLLHGLQIASNNLRHARPASEAPLPDIIFEDADHGQLAQLEEGRIAPKSLLDRMKDMLREDPNADLGRLEDQT